MDANLKAALASRAPTTFTAVDLTLPGDPSDYELKLVQGGSVDIEGTIYTGKDATYGAFSEIGTISDGVDSSATTASLVLMPPSEEALAELANPLIQGAPITIRQGAVDRETGESIGTELLFRGEVNQPVLMVTGDMRAIRLDLITEEARQLEPNDERRLSHAFHQSVWGSGELGLIHVTGVTQKDFWRVDKPSLGVVGGGGGGAGGSVGVVGTGGFGHNFTADRMVF